METIGKFYKLWGIWVYLVQAALRLDIEHTDGKAYFSPPPEPRVGPFGVTVSTRKLEQGFRMIRAEISRALSYVTA